MFLQCVRGNNIATKITSPAYIINFTTDSQNKIYSVENN